MTKRTRSADLGNGTYLNPIMFGNYSDPSIFRDGEDYYMLLIDGLVLHSQDLVNWEPLYTLHEQMAKFEVNHPWAPDLVKHGDTYYYYAFANTEKHLLFVMTTKDIKNGPWTDPIIMGVADDTPEGDELIDPALVFDLAGKPHLMMSKNCMYPLSDDCTEIIGPFKQVADDPPIPDEYDIEGVYTEGPKFCYRNGYYYLMVAAGGTLGPATAHGVFAYRAKDIHGPWELSPYNPISHTDSSRETWWTKGHASFIDTPDGEWYILYHGILKDYLEQGRMLLMEPIEWTDDGWFRIPEGVRPDMPLPMPKNGKKVTHGYPLSVDLTNPGLPLAWQDSNVIEQNERLSFTPEGMKLRAEGEDLNTTDPILYSAGFENFEVVAEMKVGAGAGGGLTMYTTKDACCGIALKDGSIRVFDQHKPLLKKKFNTRDWPSDSIFFKLRYYDHSVSHWYSADGENWTKLNICAYVAVYCAHANYHTWLRPGVFAYGDGEITVKSFEIKEIEGPKA